MSQIKIFLPVQYLAVRNGTLAQNTAYCSKEGKLIECGERPAQGRRVDLISVKRRIDDGDTVDTIEDDQNFFGVIVKHRKFFEQYERKKRRITNKGNHEPIEVYIRHGLPGTGKTRFVYDFAKKHYGGSIYRMPTNSGTNFGSYNGESVVLFDDVKINEVPSVTTLKKPTDRYPEEVRVLYGYVPWKPKVIFLTSNHVPGVWWSPDQCDQFDWEAIKRRVKTVVQVYKDAPDEVMYTNPQDGVQEKGPVLQVVEQALQENLSEEASLIPTEGSP
jgi:hypothetical protein